MKKTGFIGMGNMATAIASGMIGKGLAKGQDILAYAPHYDKLRRNADRIGFVPVEDIKEMVRDCDTLIMACKPYQIEEVLDQIGSLLGGKALLSIAAGWDFDRYAPLLPPETRFQFIMPNTPVMVGEGVLLFEEKNSLLAEEREEWIRVFGALGMVRSIPSRLMGIAGAITGCGPAFIDMVIEALGDAGVKYGIARKDAYAMAAKMIAGSARLQLETGEHPGVLKDMVCSPAGTTIRGVDALEHAGLRAAMIDAIDRIMK
ncbi:MAG: pyrroline-5-carboxylate reductase [Eubacterium sp.]|nr:pyrroline-5-carboxylate reductase [Eubacterium sp.]